MASSLWNNFKYTAPIDCLIDVPIRVYDIRKANISILTELGYLTKDQYAELYNAQKLDRDIFIGRFQGNNPEASKALADGILEAKRLFFEMNNIEDRDILEINNDAVYIIGNKPIRIQQVSSLIYFNLAEEYTSFYSVKKIRYFYYANRITRTEYLRAKGIGSSSHLHENFMFDFLKELFFTAQFEGVVNAINLLNIFYNKYINRELDLGYYRTLNASSIIMISNFDQYATYGTDNIYDARLKRVMDISYNERVLREFNKLLSNKYFKGNR